MAIREAARWGYGDESEEFSDDAGWPQEIDYEEPEYPPYEPSEEELAAAAAWLYGEAEEAWGDDYMYPGRRSWRFYDAMFANYDETVAAGREQVLSQEAVLEAELKLVTLGEDPVWRSGWRYVEFVSKSAGRGPDGVPRPRRDRDVHLIVKRTGKGRLAHRDAMTVVAGEPRERYRCFWWSPDGKRVVLATTIIHPDVEAGIYLTDEPDENVRADTFFQRVVANQAVYDANAAILARAGVKPPLKRI